MQTLTQYSILHGRWASCSMFPPELSPDGSEKEKSEPSSLVGSGEYRYPKSNVSETEARMREDQINYYPPRISEGLTNTLIVLFGIVILVAIGIYLWLR